MRLLRLYVGQHRVLRELDMHFDPTGPHEVNEVNERKHHLDFLVGVNGTGKSTVLRLLGQIFRGVQASSMLETPFILEYWLDNQKQKVRVANIHPRDKTPLDRYFVTVATGLEADYETEELDEQHLADNISSDLLPARVIAYTTGNEVAWQENAGQDVFDSSSLEAIKELSDQDRALNELPGWVARAEKREVGEADRFRFISQESLVLVALTGLLLHRTYRTAHSPLQDVLKEVGLKELAGFSLQFDLSYASESERRDIWERLGQRATRAIRNGGKFHLVFDLTSADPAAQLLETNGGALGFFEMLANWYSGKERILPKVTLFLERTSKESADGEPATPPLHIWDWLSDGERSFLGRMCLFLLFGEVESLILLDEPEVHFNDYWKRHIVSTMHEVFKWKDAPYVSHVVVATHSSISLSDVHPEDILILERQNLFTSETTMPRLQTFGADPSEIMVHVFGAPHATGQYSVNEIEEWLSQSFQKGPKERRDYLQDRLDKVAPGYWAYRIRREMVGLPLQ